MKHVRLNVERGMELTTYDIGENASVNYCYRLKVLHVQGPYVDLEIEGVTGVRIYNAD